MNRLIISLLILLATACDNSVAVEDIKAIDSPPKKVYQSVNMSLSLTQSQGAIKVNDLPLNKFTNNSYETLRAYVNEGKIINFKIAHKENINFSNFVKVLRSLQKNIGESFYTCELDSLKIYISESHRISLKIEAYDLMLKPPGSTDEMDYVFYRLKEDSDLLDVIKKIKDLNINALILYEKSFYLAAFNEINWSRGVTIP